MKFLSRKGLNKMPVVQLQAKPGLRLRLLQKFGNAEQTSYSFLPKRNVKPTVMVRG